MGRRVRRNLVLVLLIFLLVCVLVVLARWWTPAEVLPPESAEMQRLRFSRTENAWFVLEDAVGLLPARPFRDPRTTFDFKFGVLGTFTGLYLDDDDPEHAAWVRGCAGAVEKAREALEMEHLLLPTDFARSENPWERCWDESQVLGQLPGILLATGALEMQNGASPEVVFGYMRDGLRLSAKLNNAVTCRDLIGMKNLSRLARRLDGETQRLTLAWLIDFDASRPAPRQRAEDWVRLEASRKGAWKQQFEPFDPKDVPRVAAMMARSGLFRRVFAANAAAIVNGLSLTRAEYGRWSSIFPDLAEAAHCSYPFMSPESLTYWNTGFQNMLSVFELVLALELFEEKYGNYPMMLRELSPEFLRKVPNNAMWNQPFFYQRAQGGYWLATRDSSGSGNPAKLNYSDVLVGPAGFE